MESDVKKNWVVRVSSTITMIKQTKGKSNFIKSKEKHCAEHTIDSRVFPFFQKRKNYNLQSLHSSYSMFIACLIRHCLALNHKYPGCHS